MKHAACRPRERAAARCALGVGAACGPQGKEGEQMNMVEVRAKYDAALAAAAREFAAECAAAR